MTHFLWSQCSCFSLVTASWKNNMHIQYHTKFYKLLFKYCKPLLNMTFSGSWELLFEPDLWLGERSRANRAKWPSSSSRPWSRSAGRGRWWSSATINTWTNKRLVLTCFWQITEKTDAVEADLLFFWMCWCDVCTCMVQVSEQCLCIR